MRSAERDRPPSTRRRSSGGRGPWPEEATCAAMPKATARTRSAVPAQDRLALVADADRVDGLAGRLERGAAGGDDGVEQLLRVLLDRPAGAGLRMHRRAALAEHAAALGDDQRLRRGGALVDREDVHAPAGMRPLRMCSVPSRCSRSARIARAASWAASASMIRSWSAFEWRRTCGGCAMWAMTSET